MRSEMTIHPMTRPNIILIMSDQQRADTLACYGNRFTSTPNIDRLAAGGVSFAQAFTTFPICTPARASMWTGVYPHTHGVVDNVYGIDHAIETISKVKTTLFDLVKKQGYTTVHFGKWHLGEAKPDFFDVWEASFNSLLHHWVDGLDSGKFRPELQTDRAIEFLRSRRPDDAPFLMVQGYYPPHDPYTAPAWCYEPYRGRGVPFAGYYAAVTALDHEVGRLIAALEETAQLQNTVVIYYSDHGDAFRYRIDGDHKEICFDDAIRVPFVMSWPGVLPSGYTVHQPISLADLLPTVLALAGATPHACQGESFLPLAQAKTQPWRAYAYIQNRTHTTRTLQRCYWTKEWKLIASLNGPHNLFDLIRDPEEEMDLFNPPVDAAKYRNEPSHAEAARDLAVKLRDAAERIDDDVGVIVAAQVLAALGPG